MTVTENKTSSAGKHRAWSLDLLRILATFAIVLLHTTPLGAPTIEHFSAGYWITNMIGSACRVAVPVFFMISGALFLSPAKPLSTKRLYAKTIARMAVSFLCWAGLYALTYCLLTGKGKWRFLNELLRGHYHMWFVLTITGLYILTPLLRVVTQNEKATRYLLAAGLMLGFAVPRGMNFLLLFDLPHKDVFQSIASTLTQINPFAGRYALVYYVLGHALHSNPPGKALRRMILAGGVLGYTMTVLLSAMHLSLTGEISAYFYDAPALGVLMMGVALFVLFDHLFAGFVPGKRAQQVILHLSACSYGVYLAHAFFLERMDLWYFSTPAQVLIGVPLKALLVYALAYAVSATLHRIPILRDWVV